MDGCTTESAENKTGRCNLKSTATSIGLSTDLPIRSGGSADRLGSCDIKFLVISLQVLGSTDGRPTAGGGGHLTVGEAAKVY